MLKHDDAVSVDGFPGRSIYVQVKNGDNTIYARSVFVIANGRIYNYLFLSLDETQLSRADVKGYFDSFHIVP